MRSESDFVTRPSRGAAHARPAAGSAKPGGICWRILAGMLGVAAAALPAQAINVYVMSSGDASLDSAVQSLLTTHGHTSTVGQEFWQFDGTDSLAGFDAVYMQVGYNSTSGDMPDAGQSELVEFLYGGGGIVTSEWAVYQAAAGDLGTLQPFFPAEATPPGGGYDARIPSGDPLTLQELVNDPTLSAGLSTSFSFASDTSAGGVITECMPRASLPSAVEFYQVSTPSSYFTSGLVGVPVGGGGMINLNAIGGANEIADANFGQLLVNSLVWASSQTPAAGTDLAVTATATPGCVMAGAMVDYSVRVWNIGADTSGPITLTVDLPDSAVATYTSATPSPSMVTATSLTFDLSALSGSSSTDVSITLTTAAAGVASITETATTTSDTDPSNDSAMAQAVVSGGSSGGGIVLESGDAPDLAGGQTTGTSALTAIEGQLYIGGGRNEPDTDMYAIRVDDWSTFSASTVDDPQVVGVCDGLTPFDDTSLYLFDAKGYGIAWNGTGGTGNRAVLDAGNAIYAGRTNGEIVWLAITGRTNHPLSWTGDSIFNGYAGTGSTTSAPDGPGADSIVSGWGTNYDGFLLGPTYRISLTGASAVSDAFDPGTDLMVEVDTPDCAPGVIPCSIQVRNLLGDTSGPVTLTVDLPDASIATYRDATPAPSSVTSTTATFDLDPLAGGEVSDVSINFTVVSEGAASITATAATTTDDDLSNNSVTVSPNGVLVPFLVHVENPDAPELAGGQTTGEGVLTAIEGTLALGSYDADMYQVRVDDWSSFSASTLEDPEVVEPCAGATGNPLFELYLFDSSGHGIAYADRSPEAGTSSSHRPIFRAGDPLYSGRTNGENVWVVIARSGYRPNSAGGNIWVNTARDTATAPDGPGAADALDNWSGGSGNPPLVSYRIALTGVSTGVDVPGTDVTLQVTAPKCAVVNKVLPVTTRIYNNGTDPSGLITLTVDLPPTSVATYTSATPTPSMITSSTLTFDLASLANTGDFSDVSVVLTPVASGVGSLTVTATATGDVDPSNDAVAVNWSTYDNVPGIYVEDGDAPEVSAQSTGTGPLDAIEGILTPDDADVYAIRVDDWAAFSASTKNSVAGSPQILDTCFGNRQRNTGLFLFDSSGHGIACNGWTLFGGFFPDGAQLEAGNPAYAGRSNGEIVWLAISRVTTSASYRYVPTSGGDDIWSTISSTVTVPDGVGAAGVVDGWTGTPNGDGVYRVALTGVSAASSCPADLDGSGTVDVFDLLDYLTLWFPQDPAADLDGSGTVDVFDLLDYLTDWFAGC